MTARKPLIAMTGASGFVGQETLSILLEQGYRIRALIRNIEKISHIRHENLEWIQGHLPGLPPHFTQDVDIVLHIAGVIKGRARADYCHVNVTGTRELARQAHRANVKRFVLLSSITARQADLSDYAFSKREGERAASENFKGPIAIIRAPAVFGGGDIATKPILQAAQKGFLPMPRGRRWQDRSLALVYVKDLAHDLSTRAITGDYDGKTLSPATIGAITWPEFAQALSDALGKTVRPLPLPLPLLYGVAALTSATSRLFGLGHLTLGKLNEFLYEDWSSKDVIHTATPLNEALVETLRDYDF